MLIKTRVQSDFDAHMLSTDLSLKDARFFGQPASSSGQHTILGIKGELRSSADGYVEFDSADVMLLNLGSGAGVFIVPLGRENTEQALHNGYASQEEEAAPKRSLLLENDQRLLQACARENIPESIQSLAMQLLENIRTYSDDTWIEGKNRKWFTKPRNFVAITIQNTKRRLCIQVKESTTLKSLEEVEVHYDKRYVRLFLETERQLPDVIKAVRSSYLQ